MHIRKCTWICVMLVMMAMTFSQDRVLPTPAGTAITNQAFGNYKDANNNAKPQVASNIVTTIVSSIAGVEITPGIDETANLSPQSTETFPYTIFNTGNDADTFDLSALITIPGSGDYVIEIWSDLNGDGVIDPEDSIITNTGEIPYDGSYDFIIVITDVTVGGAPDGDSVTFTLEVTSQFDPLISDTVNIITTMIAANISFTTSNDNPNPSPGDAITYGVCGENLGAETAYGVVISGIIPLNTTYLPESMAFGAVNDYSLATPLTDASDGVEFLPLSQGYTDGLVPVQDVTIVWGDAAPGAYGCVFYQVVVDDDIPAGTTIVDGFTISYENEDGNPYPDENAGGTPSATVAQVYGVTISPEVQYGSATPGDSLTYFFTVTNTGNGPDSFTLDSYGMYWTWDYFIDDGPGSVGDFQSDDTPLVQPDLLVPTFNIPVLAQGESISLLGFTLVSTNQQDGDISQMTTTITSVNDPSDDTPATDFADHFTTIHAPNLLLVKSVLPAGNQPPGTVLTYSVLISNQGSGVATNIVVSDQIPNNTSYVLNSLYRGATHLSDGDDGDGGTKLTNSVRFTLAQLNANSSITCTFQVTIN